MKHAPRNSPHGFSLVEVTLAIGLIGVGIVSLLGLLPIGLNTFRDSIDQTVGAQIAQRIISEKRQTEFGDLIAGSTPTFHYFGDEGDGVASDSEAIYVARVAIDQTVSVPASGADRFVNPSIARVEVRVAHSPGGVLDPVEGVAPGPETTVFNAYIPKM